MKTIWNFIGRVLFWVLWPALFLYLYPSRRTRVLVVADGKLLLVKGWLSHGRWILPGGGIKKGELENDGAVREVLEETGLLLRASDLQRVGEKRAHEYGLQFDYVALRVDLLEAPQLVRARIEVADATWVPLKDLGYFNGLSPETKYIVNTWLNRG